jgi:hypothetical protein
MQKRSLKISSTLFVVLAIIIPISFSMFVESTNSDVTKQRLDLVQKIGKANAIHVQQTIKKLMNDTLRDVSILYHYAKQENVAISDKLKDFGQIDYLVFINPNTKNFEFIGVGESNRPSLLSKLLKYIKYEVAGVEFEAYLVPLDEKKMVPRIYLTFYMDTIKSNVFVAIKADEIYSYLQAQGLSQNFLFQTQKKEILLNQGDIPFKDYGQLVEASKNPGSGILLEGNKENYFASVAPVEELGIAVLNVTPESMVIQGGKNIMDRAKNYGLFYVFLIILAGVINFFVLNKE